MAQPSWKLLYATDSHALYVDETGKYEPELMVAQEVFDAPERENFVVFRFSLDRLKIVKGHLVPYEYDASWTHPVGSYDAWFAKDLKSIADSADTTKSGLVAAFTSADPHERAWAYEAVGGYHGFMNFDQYPENWSERQMASWPDRGKWHPIVPQAAKKRAARRRR